MIIQPFIPELLSVIFILVFLALILKAPRLNNAFSDLLVKVVFILVAAVITKATLL